MKKTINFYEFEDWFRLNRPTSFSPQGLKAIYDYFGEYEESTGESIEFDPIAIDIEHREYDNLEEFHQEYDKEDFPDIDEIRDNTLLIEVGLEGFIIGDL